MIRLLGDVLPNGRLQLWNLAEISGVSRLLCLFFYYAPSRFAPFQHHFSPPRIDISRNKSIGNEAALSIFPIFLVGYPKKMRRIESGAAPRSRSQAAPVAN